MQCSLHPTPRHRLTNCVHTTTRSRIPGIAIIEEATLHDALPPFHPLNTPCYLGSRASYSTIDLHLGHLTCASRKVTWDIYNQEGQLGHLLCTTRPSPETSTRMCQFPLSILTVYYNQGEHSTPADAAI